MYKDNLQNLITEQYVNGNINEKIFSTLLDSISKISEPSARKILSEISPTRKTAMSIGAVPLATGAGHASGLYTANKINSPRSYWATKMDIEDLPGSIGATVASKQGYDSRSDLASAATIGGAVSGLIAGLLSYGVYRTIRGAFDQCSRSCGMYSLNTPKRQICMAKCKVLFYKKIYSEISKDKNISREKKDKIRQKLRDAEQQYVKYSHYAKAIGKDPDPDVNLDKTKLFKIPSSKKL